MDDTEEQGADNLDPDVGFLYKTMLRRDPRKRQVKPVQHHLLQLDFDGLDSSSDDSDYQVKPDKGGAGSGDADSGDGSTSEDSEDESSSADSEGAEEETSNVIEDISIASLEDSNSLTGPDFLLESKTSSTKAPSEETAPSSVGSVKKMKIVICCVCLGDASEEEDEIVDCDGCGVSVHEGCYGISDSQSLASTVSSASTEPWFCDACKAGVKPHCELCPNFGGIYKETDAGRWVHIVCALYIPGVAFGDIDKLSPVTLFEMPYSKWGAKECSLCEDDRFCRTGVCIGCDAGMCRNYFHVTCAQREGLLSEAAPEEDIADPFFAYCKQHVEKNGARAKRRNFLAVQSKAKQGQDQDNHDDKVRTRVQRKLNRHRQKYQINKSKRPPVWVPTEKMPRMLFSSASALRKLMKKAELLGIQTQAQVGVSQKDIRKKWHLAPAFSTEFVSYFLDRNERMKTIKKHLRELLSQREQLQQQEQLLRRKYDKLSGQMETLRNTGSELQADAEVQWKQLSDLAGKSLKLPDVLKPKKPVKALSKKGPMRSPPPSVIHQCGVCHKTTNQHLLAKCDMCRLYYHLGCLNPPLSRMPKKTKLMGWQCSECASSGSSDSDDPDIDTNAPRRLREKIKEPSKFTPVHKERKRTEMIKTSIKRGRVKKKPAPKSKPVQPNATDNQAKAEKHKTNTNISPTATKSNTPTPTKSTVPVSPTVTKKLVVKTPKLKSPLTAKKATKNIKEAQKIVECCVCLKPGDSTSTVCCDNCRLSYHFLCLDPPQTKSPRYRGYAWFCSACEEDDDDDDDEDEDSVTIIENRSTRPSPWRRPYPISGPIPAAASLALMGAPEQPHPSPPTTPLPPKGASKHLLPRRMAMETSVKTPPSQSTTVMAADSPVIPSSPETPSSQADSVDVHVKSLPNLTTTETMEATSVASSPVSIPYVEPTISTPSPTEAVLNSPLSPQSPEDLSTEVCLRPQTSPVTTGPHHHPLSIPSPTETIVKTQSKQVDNGTQQNIATSSPINAPLESKTNVLIRTTETPQKSMSVVVPDSLKLVATAHSPDLCKSVEQPTDLSVKTKTSTALPSKAPTPAEPLPVSASKVGRDTPEVSEQSSDLSKPVEHSTESIKCPTGLTKSAELPKDLSKPVHPTVSDPATSLSVSTRPAVEDQNSTQDFGNETIKTLAPGVQVKFVKECAIKVSPPGGQIKLSAVSPPGGQIKISAMSPPGGQIKRPAEHRVYPPAGQIIRPTGDKISQPGSQIDVKRPAEESSEEKEVKKQKLNTEQT